MADQSDLFKIRVVEEKGTKVKVHYIGYGKKFDEWKERSELVLLDPGASDATTSLTDETSSAVYQPFSLYRELANKIKSSLQSSRKDSPSVKIDMTFDKLLFEGGLGKLGTEKCVSRRIKKYAIRAYSDIDSLMENGWHWRGLNESGDYCYVILDSVEFYLYCKKPLKQYYPDGSYCNRDQGYGLVFTFVRGDGIATDFGTNPDIFL
uniref:Tudor-knot domain-containing protein n=1 Tax=Amphimedon queenslandica TaxID=400682 RepID=A0A1X7SIF6_AMPQE